MSSMFSPHTLGITGGTFILNHNDSVHYHGHREGSDILHRATATTAFHNSDERFDPPKCHPNTRTSVLNKIMKWIRWEEGLDEFIMWLYGPAGAGKSAIAQTIAEMCEEQLILLASFFFSRNDPSRCTAKSLIATIAYQMTLNLPDVRDTILSAIEWDPLIFSKSLVVQVKSLIVAPLQQLAETGFFKNATSRHLIIIDSLDECYDPNVQRNIVEVLANSQRQHRLPLIFLIASRPEQHISFAFNSGVLPGVSTRIALDESYLPDKDIELFLTDKFQEIKLTHPLRPYIPPLWPLPDVLKQLVSKSSGQFIYASTVIRYVTSIRHKPTHRLDIVLGIRPPQRDLPFSELDALYTHILGDVEDIERVLEILSAVFFCSTFPSQLRELTSPIIENFLSLQPGDVQLYLGNLNSIVKYEPNFGVRILHATFRDFFVDPTRSKTFWINPRARHAAFACRCLQLLQLKANAKILWIGYYHITYHLENAEMTPELRDNLNNFSFESLQDVVETSKALNGWMGSVYNFSPPFLECLKRLPLPEADHISQTFQAEFDAMLSKSVEKYHSWPGFTLLLGSILHYTNMKHPSFTFPPGFVASLYMVRQRGEGHILDNMGFSGILASNTEVGNTSKFLAYLIEFLGNPKRSGARVFDQQRYTTAAEECFQLCLCSHHKFSKRATESAYRDKLLLRNKPWAWKIRLGLHSKIRKTMHHLLVRGWNFIKAWKGDIDQYASFTQASLEHEYYRFLSYQWALDLLPIFLENSEISMKLANVLRIHTFATMAQRFPRRVKLAREAITNYLLRVDSAVGGP